MTDAGPTWCGHWNPFIPEVLMPQLATLDVRKRAQWRKWLEAHHDSTSEIWLVFHKRHTAEECLGYDDAVEEALCYVSRGNSTGG